MVSKGLLGGAVVGLWPTAGHRSLRYDRGWGGGRAQSARGRPRGAGLCATIAGGEGVVRSGGVGGVAFGRRAPIGCGEYGHQ
jgi:hypothetical protein